MKIRAFKTTMVKSKFTISLISGLLVLSDSFSQQSVNTTGSNLSGSGGFVAYSIGQVLYSSQAVSNASLNQGVQQTYQISSTGIENAEYNINLAAYPNPTADYLILNIDGNYKEKWSYRLVDMFGEVLMYERIAENQLKINIDGLPVATYMLTVLDDMGNQVKLFKIIKN